MDSSTDLVTLENQAHEAFENEDFEKAADLFQRAAEIAFHGEDALTAAEMQNNQSVSLLKANHAAQALEVVSGTDRVFELAGDKRRQAMAYGNKAAALEALKRYDEALALYQKSAELLKETDETELRSYVLKSISALQMRQGKRLNAVVSMDAALNSQKKLKFHERILKQLLDTANKLMHGSK